MAEDSSYSQGDQPSNLYGDYSESESSYDDKNNRSKVSNKKRDKKYNKKQQRLNNEESKNKNVINNKIDNDQNISQENQTLLKQLTKNYSLTYKEIQKHSLLTQAPLIHLTKEEIQNHIRIMRQKIGRKNLQAKSLQEQNNSMLEFLTSIYEDDDIYKPQMILENQVNNTSTKQISITDKMSIALVSSFILENYRDINRSLQLLINSAICDKFIDDNDLLMQCKEEQVKQQENQIVEFFKKRDLEKILDSIKSLSFDQILNLHFQACYKINQLSLEGQTLYITFYPFINSPNLLDKVPSDKHEIFKEIIFSINRHLVDNQIKYSSNFLSIMIDLYPNIIQKTIQSDQNLQSLKLLLKDKGFSQNDITSISNKPQNFLWPKFLEMILQVSQIFRNDFICFLSKPQIISDPINLIDDFLKLFSQRRVLLTLICEKVSIQLPLQRILLVLQQLKDFDIQEIKQILQFDEQIWFREINKRESLSILPDNLQKLDNEKIKLIYDKATDQIPLKDKIPFEKIEAISKIIEEICDEYKHSYYQTIVAAAILSHYKSIIQIHMPTASGKTWVQCLIAQYWIQQDKTVLLIVPNEILKEQQQRLLIPLGPKFSIETIQEYYQSKNSHHIVIVDEYDYIIKNYPFTYESGKIVGFWDLTLTNCYMFSATCDQGVLRILKKIFGTPDQIQFKSEYEQMSGISQDLGGDIKIFKSTHERNQYLEKQINQLGNNLPIIIYANKNDFQFIEDLTEKNQIKNFLKGISIDNLDKIFSWQSGVLLLSPNESIGYNTKFRQDSKVIIMCDLESESQYLQMRGRSSRTRGVLQSEYLVISELTKSQIVLGMKKISFGEMNKLEQLLEIILKSGTLKSLLKQQSIQNKEKITSIQDLKQIMGDNEFKKLASNIK